MEWVVAVVVPVLLAVGGGIGGLITFLWRHRLEEIRATEERLSADRRKVYGDLLLPYVQLFTTSQEKGTAEARDEAVARIQSAEYRGTAFDFMLIASDDAARAYNELMQFTYKMDASGQRSWGVMLLWGQLLLEIRRSLGNKETTLTNVDMLRFLIKDIEKLEDYAAKSAAGEDDG